MLDISPKHATALMLADAGIPCFPCGINAKEPVGWLVHRGLKDRTCDRALIDKWWTQGDWNVAIVPDDLGCYVVDIDIRDGGLDVWRALCEEHGWHGAASCMVRTPSGGWHLYYRGSHANSVGTAKRGLGPGIDIRGREGYVLIPPSIIDGTEYTFA
jgi:hypothetical protein